jgi:hypothetical protein
MEKQYELRTVRVDDFMADHFQAEADRLPPSCKGLADILRQQAQDCSSSSSTKTAQFLVEVG